MLTFDSSLTDALNTHSTEAFWVLKLYYNDESSFYGVSDKDRIDGSDTYYGIVSSWGSLNQSLDFFNFTTSTGNMSVKLINTDNTIDGGRFSDLFSTYNFANRKWELFLNTDRAGTYDTSARMIGTGIISEGSYTPEFVTFTLMDKSGYFHRKIPKAVIQNTDSGADHYYTNAPDNNIGLPIPMNFGDFHDREGIGTIPTGANFNRHFTKGKFPAIVVDRWDETNATVEALVDSTNVTHNELDTSNVYMEVNGLFGACNSSNVTVSTANSKITANGSDWKFYMKAQSHNTYSGGSNYSNMIDDDFGTAPYNLSQTGNGAVSVGFRTGKVPNLGTIDSAKLLIAFGSFTGGTPYIDFRISGASGAGGSIISYLTWNGGDQSSSIGTRYSESEFFITIDNTGGIGSRNVNIDEVGIELKVTPDHSFTVNVGSIEEVTSDRYVSELYDKSESAGQYLETTKRIIRTVSKIVPASVDYLYFSGKGREYGSWITDSSRSVGYSSGDLIENPIFMIEDIMRSELGLTSTEINTSVFDTMGNNSSGYIGDLFNIAVDSIDFAFSQPKFINSRDMINKLCKQVCSWVWYSGDGKFKIKTLQRTGDYTSAAYYNKIIDFNDISLKSISRTTVNNVRNDITVKYAYDYVKDQPIKLKNVSDSTSKGTTVSGYNLSDGLKLELDADGIIEDSVANNLANAYLNVFKDQKIILKFDCLRPTYNDLEIGDIVKFSNWDSTIKLYGTAMGTDYYIISSISKKPNGCSVKAIKVS